MPLPGCVATEGNTSPHARALTLLKAKHKGARGPASPQGGESEGERWGASAQSTPDSERATRPDPAPPTAHQPAKAAHAPAAATPPPACWAPTWLDGVPHAPTVAAGAAPSWQVAASLPRHEEVDGAPALVRPVSASPADDAASGGHVARCISPCERFQARLAVEASRMDGTVGGGDGDEDEDEAERRELVEELRRLRREVKAREARV